MRFGDRGLGLEMTRTGTGLLFTAAVLLPLACAQHDKPAAKDGGGSWVAGVVFWDSEDGSAVVRHIGRGTAADGWGLKAGDTIIEFENRVVSSRYAAADRIRSFRDGGCPVLVVLREGRRVVLKCTADASSGQSISADALLSEADRVHHSVVVTGPAERVATGEYPFSRSLAAVVAPLLAAPQVNDQMYCVHIRGANAEECTSLSGLERFTEPDNYYLRVVVPGEVECFLRDAPRKEIRVVGGVRGGLVVLRHGAIHAAVRKGDRIGVGCLEVVMVDYPTGCIELSEGQRICVRAGSSSDGGHEGGG